MRVALAVAALLVLAPAAPGLHAALAQSKTAPRAKGGRVLVLGDEPGVYVQAPSGGGYVFVPLDAAGMPILGAPGAPEAPPPGSPGVPSAPRAPSSPGAPPAPGVPPAPRAPAAPPVPPPPGSIAEALAYLKTQVDPAAARVYVDGQYAGTSAEFAAGRGAIALAPGRRRIDLVLAGFRPFRTLIEAEPRQTYTLVWRLARE